MVCFRLLLQSKNVIIPSKFKKALNSFTGLWEMENEAFRQWRERTKISAELPIQKLVGIHGVKEDKRK